jgi:hypothetical protein
MGIRVEITDATEFHCFRMVLNPRSAPGQQIEVMLHATALVDLIHQCSLALCAWQKQTTTALILEKTGLSEDEAREKGLIA